MEGLDPETLSMDFRKSLLARGKRLERRNSNSKSKIKKNIENWSMIVRAEEIAGVSQGGMSQMMVCTESF